MSIVFEGEELGGDNGGTCTAAMKWTNRGHHAATDMASSSSLPRLQHPLLERAPHEALTSCVSSKLDWQHDLL